jgi:hypothetical protein
MLQRYAFWLNRRARRARSAAPLLVNLIDIITEDAGSMTVTVAECIYHLSVGNIRDLDFSKC